MDIIIILVFILLLIVALYFLFRPKKKLIQATEFKEEWRKILVAEVDLYQNLDGKERLRFEKNILLFINSIKVTGVETEVNDVDKMLVASSAVIPLFGYPGWRYRNLDEVLLYKTTFSQDFATEGSGRNVLGMVGSGAMNRMMILSKPELYRGFRDKHGKNNVGIHEFVHLVDKADGEINGVPDIFMKKEYLRPWARLMYEEIKDIKNDESDINPYAATNEAEFLSVISEYFFERPELFKKKHPELFTLLEKMYRQDLA